MKRPTVIQKIASLGTDLRRYGQVILALLWREEEIRRHLPAESLFELLEPLLVLAGIVLLRYMLSREAPAPLGVSVALFYATGFYPKYFFIAIALKKMRASVGSPRQRFPVEQRLDYVIVHIVMRALDYAILGLLVFGCIYFFITADAIPYNFSPLLPALTACAALGFGWGMFNLVLMRLIWFWGYVAVGVNRVLILISGAMFVPDFLSPNLRYFLSFNPELHAIALFRSGFYPQYPNIVLDTTYLTYCAIAAVLLGLLLDRVTKRTEGR